MSAEGFFGGTPEGWFWYKMPPEPVKPEPVKTKPVPAKPPKLVKVPKPAGPPRYSAAWLKANLPKYLNRAIDTPSRTNVLAYMTLQRMAMDKAQRFADMTERVVQTTPFLDEGNRRPYNTVGGRLANRRSRKARNRSMRWLSKRVGIWFFYSSSRSCLYCDAQAGILNGVRELYGFQITAISTDGTPPPMGFQGARIDRGQAERLNINTPIALVLVNPEAGAVVPLSHSMLTRDQVVERVILAANTAGWLPDWLYKRTRPMRSMPRLVNNVLRPENRKLPDAIASRARTGGSPVPIAPNDIMRQLGLGYTLTLSGAN